MQYAIRWAAAGALAMALSMSAAQAQKAVTVAVAGFPDSLKTGFSSFTALTLSIQTNDTLMGRENGGKLVPALATKWEALNDTTWRFTLRDGVKFHDGKPFSAEDVKFTLDRALDPKTVYGTASRISQIASVKVVDPLTVEITTKAAAPTILVGLSEIVIEPKHYYEQAGSEAVARRPIGTGPFVFQRWVPADRYELTANPNYWGGKPRIDRVVFRQIPESATRVSSLLAGETHIVEEIPIDLVERVKSSRNAEVHSVETSGSLVVTFDTRKPPFSDPRLRLAVDLAIDKNLINQQILGSTGSVLDGQLLTKSTFGHNPNLKARAYDPARAKQLLAEAGFPNGFATTLSTRSARYVSDVEIANAVIGMLDKIGIKVSMNLVEGGVWTRMAQAADMGPMHMVGWYSLGDADFNTVWFTEGGKRSFWKNDEYERLFLAARSTVDEAARLKAYHRMMEIMHEENPSSFLFGLPSVYGKSRRLTGFVAPEDRLIRLDKADLN
jgi:peptide/nickel transport system substrate-binding protein